MVAIRGVKTAAALALLVGGTAVLAAVLEEERIDAMYHSYKGDNTRVDGPALLVRKNFAEKLSLRGAFYTDTISGASIDVVTLASPYKEERDEASLGVDYLRGNTMLRFGISRSDENDYKADAASFDLAQEVFGGMTTLSLGYGRGRDIVERVDDPSFEERIDRDRYRLGMSQVLTKTLVLSAAYEAIVDEGFLNNPYRAARVQGAFLPERYPRTRTSQALTLYLLQSLRADRSLRFEYQYFTDTWDIRADTFEFSFNQYLGSRWLLELRLRRYEQNAAEFYSDNFATEQNFMARDKELSTFTSHTLGAKLSYIFRRQEGRRLGRGTLNVAFEHTRFDYDDFTDSRNGELFSFDADVMQFFVSWWY